MQARHEVATRWRACAHAAARGRLAGRRRWPRAAPAIPSPVRAEMTQRVPSPGGGRCPAGSRSSLFSTAMRGVSAASSSRSTRSTTSPCSAACGSLASTTCSSRSAVRTSSSVLLKASTKPCGSLLMKPTVSMSSAAPPLGSSQPPHRRVECGEELVLDQHARRGQAVHQRRLPRVGVARPAPRSDTARWRGSRDAGARVRVTSSSRRRKLADAFAHAPAVDLELRLTGTACADAAAQTRQVLPLARQPRQQVLQLRQLDLQLAGQAVGALREDVENELAAIDHLDLERALEVALLRRRQRVVEDGDVARRCAPISCCDLLDLAGTDERRRGDAAHVPAAPGRRPRRRRCPRGARARRATPRRSSTAVVLAQACPRARRARAASAVAARQMAAAAPAAPWLRRESGVGCCSLK